MLYMLFKMNFRPKLFQTSLKYTFIVYEIYRTGSFHGNVKLDVGL